jgi:HPt (histidine-containing phosphotransfer) domain-containing protein
LALLEEALTTRNAELARIETHALKGSLASITAERAAMLVKALEMAAQQKAWDLFQRAMPMLRLEARRIDSELADLLPPQ